MASRPRKHTYRSTALPPDLMNMLVADAQVQGITVSALIREIITGYYYNGGNLRPPQRDEAIKQMQQDAYRWLRYQLMKFFEDMEANIPSDYEEIRRIAASTAADVVARRRW